ncbi:hypothetical protein Esti_003556 [Eimeria stiedai]
MDMQMTFYWGYDATILFSAPQPSSFTPHASASSSSASSGKSPAPHPNCTLFHKPLSASQVKGSHQKRERDAYRVRRLQSFAHSKLKALCRDVQREPPKNPQAFALSGCAPPTVATAARTAGGVSSSQSPVTTDAEKWRAAPPLLQAPLSHSPYSMEAAATWSRTPEQGQFGRKWVPKLPVFLLTYAFADSVKEEED